MLADELKRTIKSYSDFPKPGILFRDISPILLNPSLFEKLISSIARNPILDKADGIIAIDARGFIFGSSLANKVNKPLILARKSNKLPGSLIEKEYGLEYGIDKLTIQKTSLANFKRIVVVDDLLATGGTAKCVGDLLADSHKEVLGLIVVIELLSLKARDVLKFPVFSEVKYD